MENNSNNEYTYQEIMEHTGSEYIADRYELDKELMLWDDLDAIQSKSLDRDEQAYEATWALEQKINECVTKKRIIPNI